MFRLTPVCYFCLQPASCVFVAHVSEGWPSRGAPNRRLPLLPLLRCQRQPHKKSKSSPFPRSLISFDLRSAALLSFGWASCGNPGMGWTERAETSGPSCGSTAQTERRAGVSCFKLLKGERKANLDIPHHTHIPNRCACLEHCERQQELAPPKPPQAERISAPATSNFIGKGSDFSGNIRHLSTNLRSIPNTRKCLAKESLEGVSAVLRLIES